MLPARPLPKETIEGLTPPADDFPYFAFSDQIPFQSTALATNLTAEGAFQDANAWWLADASLLVYGDASFITGKFEKSPLPGLGFSVDWILAGDEVRGMVLRRDDVLAIVFRGTKLPLTDLSGADGPKLVDFIIGNEDLKTDSRFLPTSTALGGRVHSGFLEAFTQISERLDDVVRARRPQQKIWLAGHSLGGALAMLAASHLADVPIEGLYTYGCPRVGDAKFVTTLPACVHRRFVHRDDFVPRLPPSWPLGYEDAGERQAVPDARRREIWTDWSEGFKNLASALQRSVEQRRIEVGDVPMSVWGLADHAPIYYATLLWNALVSERSGV